MTVIVNGEAREVAAGTMLSAVVSSMTGRSGGVAVALNDSVVPRARWDTTALGDGDRVEVLVAVQGG